MKQIRTQYAHAFNGLDLVAADTACTAGRFTELGRYTVPAGLGVAIGRGDLDGQAAAIGRIFADMRNTAAAPGAVISGTFRLDLHTPQDFVERTIFQERTEALNTQLADRTRQLPLSMIPDVIGEDWSLVLKFRPDATATVSRKNTVILISATMFEVR